MTFRDYGELTNRIREIQDELDSMGAGGLRQGPAIKYQELRVIVADVIRDIRAARVETGAHWTRALVPTAVIDRWADELEAALDD